MKSDVLVLDATAAVQRMIEGLPGRCPVVVACHGMPDAGHGFEAKQLCDALEKADHVVFAGKAQARAFALPAGSYSIVPNACRPVTKRRRTRNVGLVGRLIDPLKNADAGVSAALMSSADQVHLWGLEQNQWPDPRVITHPHDLELVYDSFDCMITLSRSETFGLVVLEALTAGIPCVVSRIPGFEGFEGAPGVQHVALNDIEGAARAVDMSLACSDNDREAMRCYVRERYSESSIATQWHSLLESMAAPRPRRTA